jgi:hypothetical protein
MTLRGSAVAIAIVAVLATTAAVWAHGYRESRSVALVSARSWVDCTDYDLLERACRHWRPTESARVSAPARTVHSRVHPRWADPVAAGFGLIAIFGLVLAVNVARGRRIE